MLVPLCLADFYLNELLHYGPSLTKALFGVLLRFRVFGIGIVADIGKAFLQIILNAVHKDCSVFTV